MLPLELGLLRASILCLPGIKSCANMPGNLAPCEPIDLQSEPPSMNAATFYKHCRHIYVYAFKVFKILRPIILITPVTETFILQIFW